MEDSTIAANPAAGPLTPMLDPLSEPTTIPPTIPAIKPENKGAPLARAIPRHSGNATKIRLNLPVNHSSNVIFVSSCFSILVQ